jgi:hypothetical protein
MATFPTVVHSIWKRVFIDEYLSPIPHRSIEQTDCQFTLAQDGSAYNLEITLDKLDPLIIKNNAIENYGFISSFVSNVMIRNKIVNFHIVNGRAIPQSQLHIDNDSIIHSHGYMRSAKLDIVDINYSVMTAARGVNVLIGASMSIPAIIMQNWILSYRSIKSQFENGL